MATARESYGLSIPVTSLMSLILCRGCLGVLLVSLFALVILMVGGHYVGVQLEQLDVMCLKDSGFGETFDANGLSRSPVAFFVD